MSRRTVLIQAADGPHLGLLEITRAHHVEYAGRHDMDYWCVHGNPAAPKRAGWAKIKLLLAALRMGYGRAIWLDADALIVRPEIDIASQITSGLGMVIHPNPAHWNTGMIVACREPQVEEFLTRVDTEPENNSAWMEQHAVNQLAALPQSQAIFEELPPAFNSTPGAVEAEHAVVRAAHGLPMATRRRLIREWLTSASVLTEMIRLAEHNCVQCR